MQKFNRAAILILLIASLSFLRIDARQGIQVPASAHANVQVGRARTPEVVVGIGHHNQVRITARHKDGTIFSDQISTNLMTNAGLNWLADIMSNTSTPSVNAQCNYIAVTNTGITPGASDTALSGEISSNGLSRAQATYAHTSNATTYTLTKVFTASGTQAAQAAGVFTAASSGTMCFEDTFTSASLLSGDTLTIVWTVTI